MYYVILIPIIEIPVWLGAMLMLSVANVIGLDGAWPVIFSICMILQTVIIMIVGKNTEEEKFYIRSAYTIIKAVIATALVVYIVYTEAEAYINSVRAIDDIVGRIFSKLLIHLDILFGLAPVILFSGVQIGLLSYGTKNRSVSETGYWLCYIPMAMFYIWYSRDMMQIG